MGNVWVLWSLYGWPAVPYCLALRACSKTPRACWKGVKETNKYSKKLLILVTAILHVSWLQYIVCREKGKPWQIEFSSSSPHGQWIFTSRALLTLKASAWRTNAAAGMFNLWTITRGLNAHCRQTRDDIKSNPCSAAADVTAATWRSLIIASRACDVKTEERARDPTKTCRKV